MKFVKFLSGHDYVKIAFIVILAYWPISFFIASVKWDAMNISIPWRYYIAGSLKGFNLPLWYPNQNLGFAQYIDPQTWYWPSWLLSIFGYTNLTFHIEFVFHLVVAAIGVYHFSLYKNISRSSSITVAIVYSLSGFFIGNAQHFGWIVSATWIPIVMLHFIKFIKTFSYKNLVGTSLSLFLLTTGGYWGFVISVYYSLVIVFLFRFLFLVINKKSSLSEIVLLIKRSLLLVILNVLTTSIVLYSTITNIELIERGNLEIEQLLYGSLFPVDFLSLFAPIATYVESFAFWQGDISLINIFIGSFSVLIIVYSLFFNTHLIRLHWKLVLVIVISFVLAMGETLPLRRLLALYVPLFDYFRFPSLYRAFAIFAICLLLGHCIDQIRSWRLFSQYLMLVVACYLLTAIMLFVMYFDELRLFVAKLSLKPRDMPLELLFIVQLLISMAFFLGFLIIYKKYRFKASALLKFFLIAEVILVAQLMFPHTVVSIKSSPVSIYSNIKELENASKNLLLDKISLNEAENLSRKSFEYGLNKATYLGLVSYWAYTPYQFKNYTVLENDSIMEKIKSMPLIYLSDNNGPIKADYYKLNTTVEPNKFTFVIDNKCDEYLKLNLSQNYHFGWHCYVNKEKVDINMSNISLMSIDLASGRSEVEFVFRPDYVHILFVLSVICFLFQLYFYLKIKD